MDQYPSDIALATPFPPSKKSRFYGKPLHDRDRFEQWFEDRRIPLLDMLRGSRNFAEFLVKYLNRPKVIAE